jgi:hypothetical protein
MAARLDDWCRVSELTARSTLQPTGRQRERVWASMMRFIETKLKLNVNQQKC